MNKYQLYIGLNKNTRGKWSKRKASKIIAKITSKYFSGFTMQNAVGFWQGKQEKTIILTIINENKVDFIIETIIQTLKKQLKQDSIMLTTEQQAINFI